MPPKLDESKSSRSQGYSSPMLLARLTRKDAKEVLLNLYWVDWMDKQPAWLHQNQRRTCGKDLGETPRCGMVSGVGWA
jgi:hypothetical protein